MALVSSISSMFVNSTPLNETQRRKNNLFNVLDRTLLAYSEKLSQGKIKIRSTQDLERVVRCVSMLSDLQVFSPQSPQESQNDTDKISQTINPDDPDVKLLYNKLYLRLNQDNNVD